MTKIKVGIVGTGFIGPAHIEALRRLPNIDVAALCEVTIELAEAKAKQLGIGRAGSTGHAVSLVEREEMGDLRGIERLLKRRLPVAPPNGFVPQSANDLREDNAAEAEQRRAKANPPSAARKPGANKPAGQNNRRRKRGGGNGGGNNSGNHGNGNRNGNANGNTAPRHANGNQARRQSA